MLDIDFFEMIGTFDINILFYIKKAVALNCLYVKLYHLLFFV